MISSVTVQKDFKNIINKLWVKKVIHHILIHHIQLPEAGVSIAFMDNEEIRKLNHAYRSIDAATDVLSFANQYQDPETGKLVLGDIAISVPQVQDQAVKTQARFIDEVCLMLVHGTLHLIGHDHGTKIEKKAMWEMQNNILADLKQQSWYESF